MTVRLSPHPVPICFFVSLRCLLITVFSQTTLRLYWQEGSYNESHLPAIRPKMSGGASCFKLFIPQCVSGKVTSEK